MAEKNRYTAVGRRKRSVAKVTLTPGKGNITVNGKDVHEYFPFETKVMDLTQPLELTNMSDKFDVNATDSILYLKSPYISPHLAMLLSKVTMPPRPATRKEEP